MKVNIAKDERKFVKLNSISQCLKCSICYEVFFMPTRLFCGHTFCYDCINSCITVKPNCPICRTTVDPNNVGKDLLAFSMISELQVFCIHEDCSWKGQFEMLELHLAHECLLNNEQNQPRRKQKNKAENEKVDSEVDEEVKEKINLNINKGSLISRAMMKDDSMKVGIKFDVARKMLRTESFPMDKSQKTRKKETKKQQLQNKEAQNRQKQHNDDLDFLMQLYE